MLRHWRLLLHRPQVVVAARVAEHLLLVHLLPVARVEAVLVAAHLR